MTVELPKKSPGPAQARLDKGLWWDRAWSLVEGCSPVSEGCAHCWSAAQAHIRAGQQNEKIQARYGGLTEDGGRWTGEIRLMWDEIEKPLKVKKPTVWATWNDLFHPDVPTRFIDRALDIMESCPQHLFLALTKRPENIMEKLYKVTEEHPLRELGGGDYIPNLWLGTTIESPKHLDRAWELLKVWPVALRFLSLEPLLGPIDLTGPLALSNWVMVPQGAQEPRRVDFVIAGGESGPGARPCHMDWLRSIRDQCEAAGVPYFCKQLGSEPWDTVMLKDEATSYGRFTFSMPGPLNDGLGRSKRAGKLAVLDGNIHQGWPKTP